MYKCMWVYRGVVAYILHSKISKKMVSYRALVPRIGSLKESLCAKILKGFFQVLADS